MLQSKGWQHVPQKSGIGNIYLVERSASMMARGSIAARLSYATSTNDRNK